MVYGGLYRARDQQSTGFTGSYPLPGTLPACLHLSACREEEEESKFMADTGCPPLAPPPRQHAATASPFPQPHMLLSHTTPALAGWESQLLVVGTGTKLNKKRILVYIFHQLRPSQYVVTVAKQKHNLLKIRETQHIKTVRGCLKFHFHL